MSSLGNFQMKWMKKHIEKVDMDTFERGFNICLRKDCKLRGLEVCSVSRYGFSVTAIVYRPDDGKCFCVKMPDVRLNNFFANIIYKAVPDADKLPITLCWANHDARRIS